MTKLCKGKNCGKVLGEGYKYDKCEACRNRRNDTFKRVIKGLASVGGVLTSLVFLVDKNNSKK